MLFSVIIPVYNVEKYLKKCIDSLLEQKYSDMEIIMIDDKSTDHSLDVAKRYQDHPAVKIVEKDKNSGLSDTRNLGLKNAVGQYVLFLDSDDYVEPGCMLAIEEIIKREKRPSVVYFGFYAEWEGTDETSKNFGYVLEKNRLYTGKDFATQELKHRKLRAPVWFGVYKREFLLEHKLYFESGILHEDELWTPQVVLSADTIYVSEYAFYHYVKRKGSITTSDDKTKNGVDMHFVCKKLEKLSESIEDPMLKKYMDNHIAMLYMKGMTVGKLYKKQVKIDRFYPLRKAYFLKDRAKAILFAISLKLYYKINTMEKKR